MCDMFSSRISQFKITSNLKIYRNKLLKYSFLKSKSLAPQKTN